jgi:hypothetical protein
MTFCTRPDGGTDPSRSSSHHDLSIHLLLGRNSFARVSTQFILIKSLVTHFIFIGKTTLSLLKEMHFVNPRVGYGML